TIAAPSRFLPVYSGRRPLSLGEDDEPMIPPLLRGLRGVRVAVCPPPTPPDPGKFGVGSPAVPAEPRKACEHLEIGPLAERFDPLIRLIRLSAVFTTRRDDQLTDIGATAMRLPTRGEQAQFRVGTRPEPEPGKETALTE